MLAFCVVSSVRAYVHVDEDLVEPLFNMEPVVCLDTTALVAVPVFPNSVRWSEENLLAAAAGHLVTILVNEHSALCLC